MRSFGGNYMITTSAKRPARAFARPTRRSGLIGWIALLGLLVAGVAHAENVLEDIAYTALPGGKVEVTMKFSQPVAAPQIFKTESPPRIAIDLADTRNGVTQRRIEVGAGATSAISAIEAAGRTRVVVDLFRPAAYETSNSGNTMTLTIAGGNISVKGPKGTLSVHQLPGVTVAIDGGVANITLGEGVDDKFGGTARALIANMVTGVSQGYERKLELVGVGYRAAMQGKALSLSLGFSHPVVFDAPEGISIETPTQTEVLIKGTDKQVVGQVAAKIRGFRPPEPYKGKGVRYAGEKITLKEAKKA